MSEQITFDLTPTVQRADTSAEERNLKRLHVPASFAERPDKTLYPGGQDTFSRHLLEEELSRPDPADARIPREGDSVEVLDLKWRGVGWVIGTAKWVNHPHSQIFAVEVVINGKQYFWSCVITRREWRRNPNIDKGPIWRWSVGQADSISL